MHSAAREGEGVPQDTEIASGKRSAFRAFLRGSNSCPSFIRPLPQRAHCPVISSAG
jgi:hypothetical protein